VRAGEVLGLAGMVGAGRTELARLLCGAAARKSGEISLDGMPMHFRQPKDAISAGLAYLTEDRKIDGLLLDMAVADNINLSTIGHDARFGGILDRRRGQQRVVAAIRALDIRATSPAVGVGSLSGGNQQKVLLSRLLETHPKVLILDEPTRGVDIGAKLEIYRIIDQLARAGVAILLISSELAEIIGIADRVLVMREGRMAGELAGSEMSQENIIALATGSQASVAKRALQ
jgi:ribose transport system ATP-binding protein